MSGLDSVLTQFISQGVPIVPWTAIDKSASRHAVQGDETHESNGGDDDTFGEEEVPKAIRANEEEGELDQGEQEEAAHVEAGHAGRCGKVVPKFSERRKRTPNASWILQRLRDIEVAGPHRAEELGHRCPIADEVRIASTDVSDPAHHFRHCRPRYRTKTRRE